MGLEIDLIDVFKAWEYVAVGSEPARGATTWTDAQSDHMQSATDGKNPSANEASCGDLVAFDDNRHLGH